MNYSRHFNLRTMALTKPMFSIYAVFACLQLLLLLSLSGNENELQTIIMIIAMNPNRQKKKEDVNEPNANRFGFICRKNDGFRWKRIHLANKWNTNRVDLMLPLRMLLLFIRWMTLLWQPTKRNSFQELCREYIKWWNVAIQGQMCGND